MPRPFPYYPLGSPERNEAEHFKNSQFAERAARRQTEVDQARHQQRVFDAQSSDIARQQMYTESISSALIEEMRDTSAEEGETLVDAARELARNLHKGQVRRESGLSFFDAHLEPVANLVRMDGGDAVAIAIAYLHDALEDVGQHTREQIGNLSREVLTGVDMLTEEGETWEDRKASYLVKIPLMNARTLLVSVSDKIVTGRDFIHEWQQGNFGKRPARILWFYDELWRAYQDQLDQIDQLYDLGHSESCNPNIDELFQIIQQLKNLANNYN